MCFGDGIPEIPPPPPLDTTVQPSAADLEQAAARRRRELARVGRAKLVINPNLRNPGEDGLSIPEGP